MTEPRRNAKRRRAAPPPVAKDGRAALEPGPAKAGRRAAPSPGPEEVSSRAAELSARRSAVDFLKCWTQCGRRDCRRARRCADPAVGCFLVHRDLIRELLMPTVVAELRRRGMMPPVPVTHVPKFRLPEPDELPPPPPFVAARDGG